VHEVHADQCAGNGERAAFEEAALRFSAATHPGAMVAESITMHAQGRTRAGLPAV
jgi:hypothetical protein